MPSIREHLRFTSLNPSTMKQLEEHNLGYVWFCLQTLFVEPELANVFVVGFQRFEERYVEHLHKVRAMARESK